MPRDLSLSGLSRELLFSAALASSKPAGHAVTGWLTAEADPVTSFPAGLYRSDRLSHDLFDDAAVDVGEAELAALEEVSEPLVVDAE